MYEILLITSLIGIMIATFSDLKTREVPDYLSYTMISAGILGNLILAAGVKNFLPLIWMAISIICGFGFGYFMNKSGQWGGGDTKLLVGCASLIGYNISLFFDFFANLLICGAFYGIFSILFLGIKNFEKVKKDVGKIDLFFIILGIFISIILIRYFLFPFSIFIGVSVILLSSFRFMKAVEKNCFIKYVDAVKLTEGDWIIEEIKVGNEKILPSKEGLSKKDVEVIKNWWKSGKVKKVKIKEGIPFVPSFLISYFVTIFIGNIVMVMLNMAFPELFIYPFQ